MIQSSFTAWSTTISVMKMTAILHLEQELKAQCQALVTHAENEEIEQFGLFVRGKIVTAVHVSTF